MYLVSLPLARFFFEPFNFIPIISIKTVKVIQFISSTPIEQENQALSKRAKKRRRLLSTFIVLSISLFFLSYPSIASTPGKSRFKSKCLCCHTKNGEARNIGPTKYASIQWVKFFSRKKHKRKKDISLSVFPDDIELIKVYLVAHAADSDRPEAAGLR